MDLIEAFVLKDEEATTIKQSGRLGGAAEPRTVNRTWGQCIDLDFRSKVSRKNFRKHPLTGL